MQTDEFDSLWNNKNNWKYSLFYNCKEDPRVIVPKRPKWAGRTLNFAHKKSYIILLLTILAVALPFIIFSVIKKIGSLAFFTTFFAAIIGIVIFYYNADIRN